ncbi:MAG TPA: type I-MYXAN CRISPR-associated protein Cmx8 [Phycisphaerales bacterium]|nr:type I-MYXAN CRISPR-associated protein Cmx8 [Phycisphaerales bacterium]
MTPKKKQLDLFDAELAKPKSGNTSKEEQLTIKYHLFDLPTAQHKAGLAGLLVMIESMKRRGLVPLPEVKELGATGMTISLTEKSLQTLCDDLFDAEIVEVRVKKKWQGKQPKETVEITVERDGKKKQEKRFIYDVLRPKGLFLQTFFQDEDGAWVQLWRNMLWNVLRAQPTTRKVYEERSLSKHSSFAAKMFASLAKEIKNQKAGKRISEGIAGPVFIGAQDKNAEMVSFAGAPSQNFLLHFWHIVSLVFVPRFFTIERSKEGKSRVKWQDHGFTLVIPEPSHLEYFKEDIIDTLMRLETDMAGARPKRAIIDLSMEGGLEYLYYLARYRGQRQGFDDCVNAVEIYHVEKQGNNVRMLAAERIAPETNVLARYERLRQIKMNPVFKNFYLQNIVQGTPWYQGSLAVMTSSPIELLTYIRDRTPVNIPYFSIDAGRRFFDIQKGLEQMEEEDMKTEEGRDDLLARRIHDLIRQYVRRKAESKSGKNVKNFEKTGDNKTLYPQDYREAVEKVSMDAFLSMRGRREQDFVEYFTGTICSVPQFLPEDDFLLVSQALISEWERVKALSMLAISACSYLPKNRKENNGE